MVIIWNLSLRHIDSIGMAKHIAMRCKKEITKRLVMARPEEEGGFVVFFDCLVRQRRREQYKRNKGR